jgi:hypothetical protein
MSFQVPELLYVTLFECWVIPLDFIVWGRVGISQVVVPNRIHLSWNRVSIVILRIRFVLQRNLAVLQVVRVPFGLPEETEELAESVCLSSSLALFFFLIWYCRKRISRSRSSWCSRLDRHVFQLI